METLPKEVVQHLSGFLDGSGNGKLARVSKRFRKDLLEVQYEFCVVEWNHKPNSKYTSYESNIYVWSKEEKDKLVERFKSWELTKEFWVFEFESYGVGHKSWKTEKSPDTYYRKGWKKKLRHQWEIDQADGKNIITF